MKQKILKHILRTLAKGMLQKHKPLVVAVTGSVGKSSAKEAIALALEGDFTVRKTEGNLNNEFGAPLTILGLPSGGNSSREWFWILLRALVKRFSWARYPEALVLELGVDRPGDMVYLLSFIPVDVGVVTHVSGSHLQYFKSLKGIAKEKGEIIRHFKENQGIAILNADNTYTAKMAEKTNAREIITYGFSEESKVRAMYQTLIQGSREKGSIPSYSFKLAFEGKNFPVRLPNIIAEHHLHAALAALSVAAALKLNLVTVTQRLEKLAPLPGRLRVLPGVESTLLLDDTYNASPVSTKEAIRVLGNLESPRKVAVLGDMLELGVKSDEQHRALKNILDEAGVDVLVLVGTHMKSLFEEYQNTNLLSKKIYWEASPVTVAKNIRAVIQPKDTILLKGSQGMRVELVTKALLIDPDLAEDYLCRQSPAWQQKAFTAPEE
jgi:UDP-N-acetylmuramoyl-tripeptide--D-alanyl-D-alanine ligase